MQEKAADNGERERELVEYCFSGGGKVLRQPWVVLLVAGGFIYTEACTSEEAEALSFG